MITDVLNCRCWDALPSAWPAATLGQGPPMTRPALPALPEVQLTRDLGGQGLALV